MTHYTKDELIQCIYECMLEALPDVWRDAYMWAAIDGNEINSKFRYTNENEERDFRPKNVFAPLNAAKELILIINKDVHKTNSIKLTITPTGTFQISFNTTPK